MSSALPIALTIAGSDSGGGAGIQADLKTFASLGVHGVSAITCLTAQNPRGVQSVQPASEKILRQQLDAVFAELPPTACKTGMLFSRNLIRVITRYFSTGRRPPLIVDPVMIATSGTRLLEPDAIRAVCEDLLPLAALVTPNLDETAVLTGIRVREPEDLRHAARVLMERFGCATLIKGGHLEECSEALDLFYDGETELLLRAPFVRGVSTHGTGCTYSAAITAFSARGHALPDAVSRAKDYISQAIAQSVRIGRHSALNWFWQ